ncbi:type II secretion system major pseudopilin GspG [Cystobacter fuscus]|uniref:type II secretion system major pseudopilin GspG n=1 Tax=Cystobacter fuscus TaxID=43 RepID=UPI0037C12985
MRKGARRHRARGMTLIEIMVVITILGLIMAAVGVAVIPQLDQARQRRARMDFHALRDALKVYYAKKGRFPDTATGLRELVDHHILETLPKDPWGNEYIYMKEGGKPRITTYGGDGTAGGEGSDADLCSCDPEPEGGTGS